MIREFFKELDAAWELQGREPLVLHVIGSTALFLQCDYERGTKDSDVMEVEALAEKDKLLKLAGDGTSFAKKHRMYLQVVTSGIPFLPPRPAFRRIDDLNGELRNFQVEALDVVDVVVSKLKPFRAQDQEDIRAMIGKGCVDPEKLLERFLLAKDRWLMDARARELPSYIENLNLVRREWLLVGEVEIELPGYIFET